jgi:hypothetical protein
MPFGGIAAVPSGSPGGGVRRALGRPGASA